MPQHLPKNYERFILTPEQVREDGVGPSPAEVNKAALEIAARADAKDENRGSVQVLAQALSDVVSESIDEAANRIKDDIKKDMNERLDEREKHFSETLAEINVAADKIKKGCGPA